MPHGSPLSPQSFYTTIAVAGCVRFIIVAEFHDESVLLCVESPDDVEIAARALHIRDCGSVSARTLKYSGHPEWRVLSWGCSCSAALKTFTIFVSSTGGSDVKIGWIGAVTVGQETPVCQDEAAADRALVSASAEASRKMSCFDNDPESELCDVRCFWSRPDSRFFPFLDVYLVSEEADSAASLVWQGRSASGFFVISNARLLLPLQVVLMGTDCLLQRVELARVLVSVSWL
jgi:hypothetical protein